MDAQAAARLGDEIAHGFGLAAMLAGAVVGAVVGAAAVAATVATGGAAAVIIGGTIAAGGLSMFQVVKGLMTICSLPEPTSGVLSPGSPNVFINRRPTLRAGLDVSASCVPPLNHPPLLFPVTIAEGSATVHVNGMPVARLTSKLVCGAHIKSGSPNVFVGGPVETTNFVFDVEGWVHTGLEVLGVAAILGGAAFAVAAGWAAAGALGGLTAAAEAYGIFEVTSSAFEDIGHLGDRLGPGYGDLLQGLLGIGMLLASAREGTLLEEDEGLPTEPGDEGEPPMAETREELIAELKANGVKYNSAKIVDIRRDGAGKVVFLEEGNSKAGLRHIRERHEGDFENQGITPNELPDAVMTAVSEGKPVGIQGDRTIFEYEFEGEKRYMAVSVGDNGYVVGANPVSKNWEPQ